MSALALIGLGSNLGDRGATLDTALAALAARPGVVLRAASRYHETAPVGGPSGQGPFLNAAAALETSLDPFALHALLGQIEAEAGRERRVRWGERTLDLDLLLFGEQRIESPHLIVPHPRFAVRRFVVAPLVEVAPLARDPFTQWTMTELLAHLDRRPSYLAVVADPSWEGPAIARRVAEALGADLLSRTPGDDREGLERTASDLWAQFESRQRDPDRWLVSDYYLPSEAAARMRAAGPLPPFGEPARSRSPLVAGAASKETRFFSGPTPTFLVHGPGDRGREFAVGVAPAPILWFSARDELPASLATEVVSACRASHP